MERDEVLKPCPFCGGEAILSFSHEAGRWDVWQVECERCDYSLMGPHGLEGAQAKTACVRFWNTRTSVTNEEVVSVLEDLDLAEGLIAEAKGVHDPHGGGYATDHLDAADGCIARARDLLTRLQSKRGGRVSRPICTRIGRPASECQERNVHCGAPDCFAPTTPEQSPDLVERLRAIAPIAAQATDAADRIEADATTITALCEVLTEARQYVVDYGIIRSRRDRATTDGEALLVRIDAAFTRPTVTEDAVTAALVVLARMNVPADVQELLVGGNPQRSIAPGSLRAALQAALSSGRGVE